MRAIVAVSAVVVLGAVACHEPQPPVPPPQPTNPTNGGGAAALQVAEVIDASITSDGGASLDAAMAGLDGVTAQH